MDLFKSLVLGVLLFVGVAIAYPHGSYGNSNSQQFLTDDDIQNNIPLEDNPYNPEENSERTDDDQKNHPEETIIEGSYGGQNKGGSYGGQNQGGSYGGQNQGGSYGGQNQGGSYGGQNQGGSYGDQNKGGSYGGQKQGGSYGGQNEGGSYGGQNQEGNYGDQDDDNNRDSVFV